jgi:hypothetical protein
MIAPTQANRLSTSKGEAAQHAGDETAPDEEKSDDARA